MCEADPATFACARIFVDTREGVLDEAGDLIQAIAAGAISVASIEADLAELCSTSHSGRGLDAAAVTLFKSVGTSLEDLAGAELVANAWRREQGGA
jgi:ornithine cyclodeaminase/alanine dehydrogenase-like protein (mu-crystallin family)